MKKNLFTSLVLIASLFQNSCSNNSLEHYTYEPMPVEKSVQSQNLNLELKIVQQNGAPLSNVTVVLATKNFSDQGVTNTDGVINLIAKREHGEALVFTFNN